MCVFCNFINTIFTVDNFWSIAQTILSGYAIYKAVEIAKEQIKLSNEQGKVIDRQMEFSLYIANIEKAKYELELLTRNLDTNLLQHIAGSMTKYFDEDPDNVSIVKEKLKNIDNGIGQVNDTINKAIEVYHKSIDDKPIWIKFK